MTDDTISRSPVRRLAKGAVSVLAALLAVGLLWGIGWWMDWWPGPGVSALVSAKVAVKAAVVGPMAVVALAAWYGGLRRSKQAQTGSDQAGTSE